MRAILLATVFTALVAVAADPPTFPKRSLVEVAVSAADDCRLVQSLGADVVDARTNTIRCLATAEQIADLRNMGFPVTVLLEDYTAHDPCADSSPFGFYHTYEQLRDSLTALTLRHPAICRLETLGFSVQNRLLLGVRISDNIGARENEPRLRLDGNIHGNEKVGCEVTLHAACVLADSYGVSPRVTALVNSAEILCVPMVNPDGAVANQRYNANGVDLNRDFGYMWDAWGQSPDWFSQPETRALRLDCERNRYAMSISFHSGATVVVYPWMYTPVPTADDLLFKRLVYAYFSSTGYDTMRSYRWYQTHGQSFDSRYGLDGTLEITTELHEWNPPAESLDYYCRLNQEAILYFLERSQTGIHGTVTDASSGMPVGALIRLGPLSGGRDWFAYSSAVNGGFHRPLLAGTYALQVSANGFQDTLITGIVVPDTLNPVVVDVALRRGATAAAHGIVCVQQNDTTGLVNTSLTHWVLGMPEQRSYSMSYRGRLAVDMGAGSEITDGPGPDFVVVEHPDTGDTVLVFAGRAWDGPWTYVGRGVGTCSLDLAGPGIDTIRYLLIRDGSHRPNNGPTAGYDLDAVTALNHSVGFAEGRTAPEVTPGRRAATIFRGVLFLGAGPNPIPLGESGLCPRPAVLLDASGRRVLDLKPGPNDVRHLRSGVYFVRQASSVGREAYSASKVIITR